MHCETPIPPRPAPLSVQAGQLPASLQPLRRFVVWKYVYKPENGKPGRWDKPPFIATNPERLASSTKPQTWSTLGEALAAVEDGKADGLGLVLNGDGIVGVDIDGCRDPETGTITPESAALVQALNSYTEITPSGTGLRVLASGTLPPGRRSKSGKNHTGVEMYASKKYVSLTGHHLTGTPTTIETRPEELAAVHARIFGTNGNGRGFVPRHTASITADDAVLLERARRAANGAKFIALENGDTSAYPSASEADLAFCAMLAFHAGLDAGRIDRLFRQSRLMREKWDERHGDRTYGERTIDLAITGSTKTWPGPSHPAITDSHIEGPVEPDKPAPYRFTSAVSGPHFLPDWINYASGRTDAAHDYHEAAALALLAAATPTLRARLAPYPNGLPTNLYMLFLGDSTTSRKSTSKDLARDVQDRALPKSLSADQFSPEAFVEQLAARPHNSTTLFVDEFGELLEKLHHAKHMAGLRGLLMTVYAGDDYTYSRVSKRGRDGAKVADEARIVGPHLSILGATTPAIFNILAEPDVISGLLPRFAIIMPTRKPDRRPFFEVGSDIEGKRNALIAKLHSLHQWSTATERQVHFGPGVLGQLDGFAVTLERTGGSQTETARAMLQRLTAMTVKLAMLIAAGRPETVAGPKLDVRPEDAQSAIQIARRWQGYAVGFAARIGQSSFERQVQRCVRLVRSKRRVSRSIIARQAHVDRRTLDNIRDTLVDRAVITLERVKTDSGPTREVWCIDADEEGLL